MTGPRTDKRFDVLTVSGYDGITSEPSTKTTSEDDGRCWVEFLVMDDDGERTVMLLVEPYTLAMLARDARGICRDDYPETLAEVDAYDNAEVKG